MAWSIVYRSAPVPTWVSDLTSTNTVYQVGETPSSVLPGRVSWPSAGSTSELMNGGSDNNALYLTSGYGGAVYVPELGTYGTMIFGSTGEHSITDQLTSFGLSENTPSWNFYQQPLYATSETEANTYNADWYYNESEYAALSASQKLAWSANEASASSWNSTWVTNGATYPAGYGNWIIRRKYGANSGSTLLGNNRPHWFRYSMPCYIPPSMTGETYGAILVNSLGTIYGPYNQGHAPSGASDSNWFAELNGGTRKYWLHAMNVNTKAWQRLTASVPSSATAPSVAHPHSCVDTANKRVYYTCNTGGNWALMYADFTSGLSGMTWSGPTTLTVNSGDTVVRYNSVLCVPTSGANSGKRLWYFQDNASDALILIDIDANTMSRLSVTGLPSGGDWRFSYDAANNYVYIVTVDTGIGCKRFAIPTGYGTAGNYTVETLSISMNGNSIEGSANLSHFGQRSIYLPTLGAIIVPMKTNKVLAFRPG